MFMGCVWLSVVPPSMYSLCRGTFYVERDVSEGIHLQLSICTCAQVWAGCACVLPVEVGRRETLHPCTDQHAVLWADPQLLACGSYPFFMLMRGSGGAAGPTSRNEEGPGDLGTEVVQDFRGVDQFQMAGGKPVTQHLEATEVAGLGVCVAGMAYHVAYLSLPTPEALDSGRGTQDLKGLCPGRTHRHGGGPCPPTGSD